MKAIVIRAPGGPEVLELVERPDPDPSRGEVRVRVRATAVNRADILQRLGGYPAPRDVPADIPGLEFAGEIDAVGDGVAEWKSGDRVFGLVGGGAYAERVVVHARTVSRIPDSMSFIDAAAVPEAFVTAYDAMVVQGRLSAGETALVHAVGSGVGTAAVQIAKAIGARAIGTARTESKLAQARQYGMSDGIVVADARFAEKIAAIGASIDVVLDLVGGSYVQENIACVASRGRIVLVGLVGGARGDIDFRMMLQKRVTLKATVLRSRPLEEKIEAAQLFERHIVPLLRNGVLKPVIDRVLPLEKAGEAHTYVASNAGFGKVVLSIA